MLPRDELIEAIERAAGASTDGAAPRGGRRRAAAARRPRAAEPKAEPEPASPRTSEARTELEAETEEVTGVLDRMPQGYGFLRLSGLSEAEGDVYVSASQIRRCELRPGDEVTGPAREPRRGERHRALVRVEAVNGQSPEEERTPLRGPHRRSPPHRRLLSPDADGDPLVRAVDLLGAAGLRPARPRPRQPRSGRTTLLRALGAAIADAGAHVCRAARRRAPRGGHRSGSEPCRRPRSSPPPPTRSRASRSAPPSWRWGTPSASPRPARTSSS